MTKQNSDGMPIFASDTELIRAVHWQEVLPLSFSFVDVIGREVYHDVIAEGPSVEVGRGMAGLSEEDDDWKLGDAPFPKDADLRESLNVIWRGFSCSIASDAILLG